jgi:hypothetical protein
MVVPPTWRLGGSVKNGAKSVKILFGLGVLWAASLLAAEGTPSSKDHVSVIGDFVYMRRTSIHNDSLIRAPGKSLLDSKGLVHEFEFEPGYRVSLFLTPSIKHGIEGNFLYLRPWTGQRTEHRKRSLSFPFSHSRYSEDFTRADRAHARYESHFWDAELNYWRYFSPRRISYFSLSGILGLRYFHWNETFKLTMTRQCEQSSYNIHTRNWIYGAQAGLDFQMNPMYWLSWEAFAKVGFFANATQQKQFLGDRGNTITLRDSERKETQWGFFTDVLAQVALRFSEHVYMRAGYEALFFTGLALAPEQTSKRTHTNAGKKDHTHGNAIIHGLFAGLSLGF